jgi:WhiB family transcriptional regulator, redox-sensing transcriptional regulator
VTVSAADWWQQAACRDADPDLFAYDPASDPPETALAAKQVCAGCPVTDDCLAFAFQTMRASQDLTGIYGGLTPAERTERRPPEQPHPWRRRDPEFAARSFAKAGELGVRGAARFYQVDPKTLRAAWDRHGLGRPQRRPQPEPAAKLDRQAAQQAFAFARAHSIAAAARRFGVTRRGLRAAWDRHGLGHPHQGIPLGELRARWNRDHWWRRDERVRRLQAAAQARQRQQLGQLPPGRPPIPPDAGRAPQPSGRRPRDARAGRDQERER